jgi:hypothetical protein
VKNDGGTRVEVMHRSDTWSKLVSGVSSIIHVLVTVFAAYLISDFVSGRPAISPLVFVFAGASKLVAVAFAEDRSGSRRRTVYSAVALALLFPLLLGLTTFEMVTGVLILVLYSLYPLVDGKAPFDVVHHVFRYVFIFVLGYGSLAFLNETALLAILAMALFSVAGDLLAGLRKSNGTGKSAAFLLGIKRSLIVIVSSVFIASIMAAFVFNDLFEFPIPVNGTVIPFYVIPAVVIDLFLTVPLLKALNGKRLDPFHLMRRRELMAVLVLVLLILVVLQTERIGTVAAVNSRDYSVDVGMRTFIAGPHDYDVPWIIFDYVNQSNYYYVVFHKCGVLELSQVINGQVHNYEDSVKTGLTPFQWNDFRIFLNETTVVVLLDGEYQVSTARHLDSNPASLRVSVLHSTVLCVCSININQ